MCHQWTHFSYLIDESLRKHSFRCSLLPRDSGKVVQNYWFLKNCSAADHQPLKTLLVQGHSTGCFSALRLDGWVQKTVSLCEAVSPETPLEVLW